MDIKLFILRWRRALQIALPIAFTLDAVHNAYIMCRLYRERLQDWEREQETELIQLLAPTLGRVCAHCQRKDQAFWPHGLHRQTTSLQPAAFTSSQPAADDSPDPFEQLGFGRGWVLARVPSQSNTTQPGSADAHAAKYRGRAEMAGSRDAWAPERLLAAAAQWCEAAAVRGRERAERAVQAGVLAAQQRLPVPRLQISRRSALRLRVCFLGYPAPEQRQPLPSSTCELHLS